MADTDAKRRALLKTRYRSSDLYVGTIEQLSAAELVRPDQFPGLPGMPKVCAMYFLVDGVPARHGTSRYDLTYTVQRISAAKYSVSVEVSAAEADRREALAGGRYDLPLDLPAAPFSEALRAPDWSPKGWSYRGRRKQERDSVFVATAAQLKAHGLMGQRALPVTEDTTRKSVRFYCSRFGYVEVSHRMEATFFVALHTPSEIRCANYSVTDFGHTVCHMGTKQQLQAKGLGLGLGFPGEPGCNKFKVSTTDPKTGNKVSITRSGSCGDLPASR